MFDELRLAIENLRFMAKAGGEAEFYDLLRERLLGLAEGWESVQLTQDEREALAANRQRLLLELEILRVAASQSQTDAGAGRPVTEAPRL